MKFASFRALQLNILTELQDQQPVYQGPLTSLSSVHKGFDRNATALNLAEEEDKGIHLRLTPNNSPSHRLEFSIKTYIHL